MRRLLIVLAALAAPAAALALETAEGVAFRPLDLAAALEAAKAEGKGVMVDVYATWCGPCHELDRDVFSRPEVGEEVARHWIAVKLDGEAGEGPALVSRYHVVGYPTVLFLSSSGEEVDRVFGFQPPEAFLASARGYAEGQGTLEALAQQALARPLDVDLAAQVGFRYAVRGDVVSAKRHYARIFAARRMLEGSPRAAARGAADVSQLGGTADFAAVRRHIEDDLASALEHLDGLIAGAYLALGKYVYLRGAKDYETSIRVLKELQQRFPDSPEAKEVPYQLAVAHLRLGAPRAARAELGRWLARSGGSAEVANAIAWLLFREKALSEWAVEVAEEALRAHPASAGLWDTLAELRSAAGEADAAVVAITKAVEAAPGEAYYRTQLERFTAAASKAHSEEAGGVPTPASEDASAPGAEPVPQAGQTEPTATKR